MYREMRRKERQISKEAAYDIIRKGEYGFLATVSEDGSPYCIPVSHTLSGDVIYFHCAKTGHKIDNMALNKRVCFTVTGKTKIIPEAFATEYESAVAFGTVEILENRDEKLSAILKICEKFTPENMGNAKDYAQRDLGSMHVCAIKIDHVTGKALVSK